MIAARPKQYCKNMSYIINAKARSVLARPLSNSQYIFIGLIDFSRAVAVILSKVAAVQLALRPINFYFPFRCMGDSSLNECRPSEMVEVLEDRMNVIFRVRYHSFVRGFMEWLNLTVNISFFSFLRVKR